MYIFKNDLQQGWEIVLWPIKKVEKNYKFAR